LFRFVGDSRPSSRQHRKPSSVKDISNESEKIRINRTATLFNGGKQEGLSSHNPKCEVCLRHEVNFLNFDGNQEKNNQKDWTKVTILGFQKGYINQIDFVLVKSTLHKYDNRVT
jgi:hypothetical protein